MRTNETIRAALLAALAAAALFGCRPAAAPDPAHAEAVEGWRADRDARLRAEGGWLSLVGLAWLEPGDNDFGADPEAAVPLPPGSASERAGTFRVDDGRVTIHAADGVTLTVEGRAVDGEALKTDAEGRPDVVRLGRLSMHVIDRGGRLGVRVKDPESPVRTGFTGIEHFPVDARYRVEARFVPYDPPREIDIPTVLGTTETQLTSGYAEFELGGATRRLEPVVQGPDDPTLFFIFKDETSGEETYGAGRFLYADAPEDGVVVLDFNLAYNPPCVFTPYATCPLPPRQNWLDVRIEAGEKTYGEH